MEVFGEIKCSRRQPEHDAYCWTCHRDEPQLYCSTCVRSFHISPACSHAKKMSAEATQSWRCTECIELEKDVGKMQSSGMNVNYLNNLLKCTSNLLQADEYLAARFLHVAFTDTKGTVYNPLDLTEIGDKTNRAEYICIEEFWLDIKWIVHNTKVHRSGDPFAVKALKWLTTFTKGEIYTIRLCHECYWNANQKRDDWFTKPCTKPHILLWARQKGFPYWPAKLMAVDSEKHTVDVQFFGDHKRMVVTPKDCLIYSKTIPSVNLGLFKRTFDMAMDEAEIYIHNLIMKFGTFHFADSSVLLNINMLERHLYDVIPNAWKLLENPMIPPEIPKSTSATNGRRKATSRKHLPPKVAAPIEGGPLTRRMSIAIDAMFDQLEIDGDFPAFDQISHLTETIDLKIEPATKINTLKFIKGHKEQLNQSSSEKSAKKRKLSIESAALKIEDIMNGHQNEVIGSPIQSSPSIETASVQNDRIFKVPAPPRIRKSSSIPCTIIPMANIPTIMHRPLNEPPSPVELQMKKEKLSSSDITAETDPLHITENDIAMQLSPPKVNHAPEMVALYNAMIEQNTRKVSECIRSSLETSMVDFMGAVNPTQKIQSLQDQLSQQRLENEVTVLNLQNKNVVIELELEQLKNKHDILISKNNQIIKQNNELIENLSRLKADNDKLIGDFKGEMAKNANLTSNLNAISTKNSKLVTTVNKLQSLNCEQAKSLKSIQANNAYLSGANKALMDSTEKIKAQLENLKLEHKIQQDLMTEEKNVSDLAKNKAFEECAKMIVDTKKKQWCATCGMPGGRFYCSSQCEEYYWKQQRS